MYQNCYHISCVYMSENKKNVIKRYVAVYIRIYSERKVIAGFCENHKEHNEFLWNTKAIDNVYYL